MSVMSAQLPLPLVPVEAVELSGAAGLVQDEHGGRVYIHGELVYVWDAGDEAGRRGAAVQLVRIKAAEAVVVAAAFEVSVVTLWRWRKEQAAQGSGGLLSARPGPKGPSKLTEQVVADIQARRDKGASLRVIAAAVGLSPETVRRALTTSIPAPEPAVAGAAAKGQGAGGVVDADPVPGAGPGGQLGVLAEPVVRSGERAGARRGELTAAPVVFTPGARVPLAGLFLALPGLGATGLLECADKVYEQLPDGFYGLSTMLLEGVLRALAGQPRAEGAGRFNPVDLGRVLGMDRAPEVKTIRRKIAHLAAQGKAGDLLGAMAAAHLARADDQGGKADLVLYVDGHVRAYQGTRKIAKTHLSRLRFPAPATVETWVSDAGGDPVLVVMSEPGASLAMELRRLLPDLRTAVGDHRRVLVGFDRGGWSPALFAHMDAHGFDVLTWRKGTTPDIDPSAFTDHRYLDEAGREHTWTLADTTVELPLPGGQVFSVRQVTRADTKKGQTRQVHILTTRTDLSAAQIVYRMGSRWRQENYFRYARMHLGLDSHDSYATSNDDPERTVPNPAKRHAHLAVQSATARLERERARTDASLLVARQPHPGRNSVTVTNAAHNALTSNLWAAEEDLTAARAAHAKLPARVPLADLAPGQQVLDTETKLIHHAIKIAAFNTITAIARDIRINTSYARAGQEAFTLARQGLTASGDIVPDLAAGILTIRLDPLPTQRETAAVAELCEHLTNTKTLYPGTNLVLRYEIKNR